MSGSHKVNGAGEQAREALHEQSVPREEAAQKDDGRLEEAAHRAEVFAQERGALARNRIAKARQRLKR